jgi:hypothetical protein
MKELLIVFAVLLLLLTLLSTFGGSIRHSEPFYAPHKQSKEYYYDTPKLPPNEYYDNTNPMMPPPISENYDNMMPPPSMSVPHEKFEPTVVDEVTPEPFEKEDAPLFASF